MPVFTATFEGREEVAQGTLAFRFARPEGFSFRAGQAVSVGLIDPPETDAKGNSRTFSLASPPSDGPLQVATRMRDTAFKRVLGSLEPGATVKLRGPMGNFTLPDDTSRPVVLLAGGIGVTPFMSMLREEERQGSKRQRVLLYSNRSRDSAPFFAELEGLARAGSPLRMVASITENAPTPGTTGGIADPEFLRRELEGVSAPVYYLAGPPAMVSALRQALTAMGANASDIRLDEFYGY